MNSKQAQLYEDLLDHFFEVDKHYSLTVQKNAGARSESRGLKFGHFDLAPADLKYT